MKKVLFFFPLMLALSFPSRATIFVVQIANFQFTPVSIPNVIVGDTIRWVWVNGTHTTTCDPVNNTGGNNSLPPGAPSWSSVISSAFTTFSYKVTVPGTYNYSCMPHQLSQGMRASFIASAPLPVTLSDLKLSVNNTNKPSISWKTSTEQNTSYFSVRRSYNGSNYTEIARVAAAGNSTDDKFYSYTDNTVSVKDRYAYYVVVVVDKDERQQYSETRLYKNVQGRTKIITSLSPNPINKPGHLMLQFNADKPGEMDVKVLNMEGKPVLLTSMFAVVGINSGHVHLGDLQPGTYTIAFALNGVKESYKVILR